MENRLPWYSARDADALVAGRWFGFIACFLRIGDRVYETYWSTGRGTEAVAWSTRCSIGPFTVARRPGRTHLRDGRVSLAPAGNSSGWLVDQRSSGA